MGHKGNGEKMEGRRYRGKGMGKPFLDFFFPPFPLCPIFRGSLLSNPAGGLGVMSYPSMSQDSWQSLDDKWFLVHSELKITLH